MVSRNFNYWNDLLLYSLMPLIISHHIVGCEFWQTAIGVDGENAIWQAEKFGIFILYPIYLLVVNYNLNKKYQIKIYRIESIPLFIFFAYAITYILKTTTIKYIDSESQYESIYIYSILCLDAILILLYLPLFIYKKKLSNKTTLL
ncbi:MAG: hypothetical protein IPK18_10575 [Sphingobacteriales bacterium]|jgi:hypothetical protein|nr:MAG: hypothetical protein IPK18_10575 [Sphingobacteriales bacterium]